MENKKGGTWAIVILIFVFVIAVGITVLIILNQNQKPQEDIYGNPTMNIYISIKDSQYKNPLSGTYRTLNGSNTLSGEIIENSVQEIKNVSDNMTLDVFCKSEGFYSQRIIRPFTQTEITDKKAKIDCYLDAITNLEVEPKGSLKEGQSSIELVFSTKGHYKNIGACASWTAGIINVESYFYNETEPEQRFSGLVDKCFYFNQSINKDDSLSVSFNVKSKDLSEDDELTFYIFDKDEIHTNKYEILSEYKNNNLGHPRDTIIKIR